MLLRSLCSPIILATLAVALSVIALQWPGTAFHAEMAVILVALWTPGRVLPGRAGINVANVIAWLAAIVMGLIYGALLLSKLNPIAVLFTGALLALLTFVLSVQRQMRKAEERRGLAGYCERCGYDLRKSFECCPECGADIPVDLARRRRWMGIGPELPATGTPPRAGQP